ncbi:MAG: PAS domain S-box protein, partial [Bacteroidetes bacterium]|nr:PAS domain S-box protein [Bacteroidota bacterium]
MFGPSNYRTIVSISLFTVIIGVTVIAGCVLNVPVLRQVVPGFVEMVFNMALCFVLFGVALLTTQYRSGKYRPGIYFILSGIGTGFGVVTLLEFLFHFNAGIDQLFVRDMQKISADHLYAGRMAYNSAICLTLLGAGFLLITSKRRMSMLIGQYCFHAVSIITSIALIGYLYGVSLFHSLLYLSSMATHTAVLFLLLSVGASLLNPSTGITGLFTGKQIGHRLAQRLFVLITIMFIVLGAVRIQTQHYDLFTFDTGIALLVVCFLLAFLGIIWGIARWLNKIDTMRTAAEAEVKRMNAELEKRVEERTAESKKNEEKYHSLIEQASDAIYLLDNNRDFIDVNASMCQMMGYSKDELLKMNVEEIIEPGELKNDPLADVVRNPGAPVFRERTFVR